MTTHPIQYPCVEARAHSRVRPVSSAAATNASPMAAPACPTSPLPCEGARLFAKEQKFRAPSSAGARRHSNASTSPTVSSRVEVAYLQDKAGIAARSMVPIKSP